VRSYVPTLVTPPAVDFLSLDDVKRHCRIDFDDDDTYLSSLKSLAISHLDGYTGILGRCLINQKWLIKYCDWSRDRMMLPFPNVSSVTVKYFDDSDLEQTVSSSLYQLLEDNSSCFIKFRDNFDYPTVYDDRDDGVQITITAGYGAQASDVPQAIRHAALLMIGHFHENREASVINASVNELPMAVNSLIAPYRRISI
jgi:uncharacterized phiE125 gp8 family phage protein